MLPCTLCVLQRYAFVFVILFCALGLWTKRFRVCAISGLLTSLIGAGFAIYQIWVSAQPSIQCGRDELQETINSWITAQWLPALFEADGLCNEYIDRIIGLTAPQWSLFWFLAFSAVFIVIARRKR